MKEQILKGVGKSKLFSIISLSIPLLLFIGNAVEGNDGYFLGKGDTVFPLNNTEVEMVSEKVVMEQHKDIWTVKCQFLFHNTGEDTTLQMGFPDRPTGGDVPPGWTIKDFKSYVDGKSVNIEEKKGTVNPNLPDMKYEKVFVWNVSFRKNQYVNVENTYVFGRSGDFSGLENLRYILRTGSLWKNRIQTATIEAKFEPGTLIYNLHPAGTIRNSNAGTAIKWEIFNFKPGEGEDIEVVSLPYSKNGLWKSYREPEKK